MSGGVDSSVTAALLIEQGYDVAGATLSLCGIGDEKNSADAKSVCDRLSVPHFDFNLKSQFSEFVINNFISEYKKGSTPNPCIVCNRYIKFGEMLSLARKVGYDKIATGHYARVEQDSNGRYLLYKAKSSEKDQSYVLYCLTQEQLSHVLFPLGKLTKTEVREIAERLSLESANKPDSQDICFVPDGDYAAFIEKEGKFISAIGDYVDLNGNVLGQHKGVIRYTIGQRKGLGIALGKPAFVIEKDPYLNRVVLGDEEHLFKSTVIAENPNFIPFDRLEQPLRVTAKLRYRHSAQPATIYPQDGNVRIEFDTPQRAPSKGQAAVFYDGDLVIGGGTIV